MKKLFFLNIILTVFFIQVMAQAPECINYQTLVRDGSGQLVTEQTISLKFSILKESTSGSASYIESHKVETNQFGIVNLKIGLGTPMSGSFKNINWGNGKSFLKVELDLKGSSNYTEMGITEMVSVPYALYAGSIYVNYSNDTLYIGDQWVYLPGGTDNSDIGNGDEVVDFDGNKYNTVVIGTQTWLVENLKSTHYSNGQSINGVFDYNNDSSLGNEYGKLYTWDAAMNGAASSSAIPSRVQGVCPVGCHLPSQDEWAMLKDYIHDHYAVSGGLIGQKLKEAGTLHWVTNNGSNETGFSALGSGEMHIVGGDPDFQYINESSSFWSATEYANNNEAALTLRFYDSGSVLAQPNTSKNKTNGLPVRCLKD